MHQGKLSAEPVTVVILIGVNQFLTHGVLFVSAVTIHIWLASQLLKKWTLFSYSIYMLHCYRIKL